ncbi:MAG: DUF554 domain-containing protein [Clostridia bacterium]|nr:DUF554 domain-containing protein [Clostridia bacterium]
MLGVIVNTITVILGSTIGLLCKRGIPKKLTDAVMTGIGLCTVYLGIQGLLAGQNVLILIAATVFGAMVGTLLDIDSGINRLGDAVQNRFPKKDEKVSVAEGFVTASLLFCVGSMTIVGSFNSGISGDHQMLFTKSFLDFFSSMMLSVSLGVGVICAAGFVFVFQGALVLLAMAVGSFLSPSMIAEMTCAGGLLILALGLNLTGITKIKVANYLPALVFAPLFAYLVELVKTLI